MSQQNDIPTNDSKTANLPLFSRPYDWSAIDAVLANEGGAILQEYVNADALAVLNNQIDSYLDNHYENVASQTGSAQYDKFLGHNTVRLHGMLEKAPVCADIVGDPALLDWAQRWVCAESVLLNAAEMIQINPGEPAQYPHRDTDSWPLATKLSLSEKPTIVNAIVALDEFTVENGATAIAPYSWQQDSQPDAPAFTHAVMQQGDAVLFRGDIIHGGGANQSTQPRRAFSVSYCAGWLRPVENSILNLSLDTVQSLAPPLQAVLGYAAYDGSAHNSGMVGLYENGDPQNYLQQHAAGKQNA